jgi:hypothetical protein
MQTKNFFLRCEKKKKSTTTKITQGKVKYKETREISKEGNKETRKRLKVKGMNN